MLVAVSTGRNVSAFAFHTWRLRHPKRVNKTIRYGSQDKGWAGSGQTSGGVAFERSFMNLPLPLPNKLVSPCLACRNAFPLTNPNLVFLFVCDKNYRCNNVLYVRGANDEERAGAGATMDTD
jgi:hypothetical protein